MCAKAPRVCQMLRPACKWCADRLSNVCVRAYCSYEGRKAVRVYLETPFVGPTERGESVEDQLGVKHVQIALAQAANASKIAPPKKQTTSAGAINENTDAPHSRG